MRNCNQIYMELIHVVQNELDIYFETALVILHEIMQNNEKQTYRNDCSCRSYRTIRSLHVLSTNCRYHCATYTSLIWIVPY